MNKNEIKELKVRSFRVDENTFTKFKEIAASEFSNQSQCLDALINLYETEEAKGVISTRELEIESFQDYLNKINKLFLTSLQLSLDAEERVKESFARKLEAKDEAVTILKDTKDTMKVNLEKEKKENKLLKIEIMDITAKNKELEENRSTLSQLANRNYDLTKKLEEENYILKEKIEKIKNIEKESIKLENLKIELEKEVNDLKKSLDNEESINANMKNEIDKLIKKDNDRDLEIKSYKSLIESLKKEQKSEIIALSNKLKSEYKEDLKERESLIEREFLLKQRELEFEIKKIKDNNK
ncbi:MAG: hypothetical protein ACRC57_01580 [Sarcina sp.]